MSGIVGLVNCDGAPVASRLLQQLTATMQFRGPQAQAIWVNGRVGFGHALLASTHESGREQQPRSLDGEVWITADARLDDRAGLWQRLALPPRDLATVSDAELILLAYQAWGEECVQHLLGDFAFAIWDGRRQRLFCARDHFGVRLLYYAHCGNTLVFSNTLNTVRAHPAVSTRLHEPAIGDYLLFGCNLDATSTSFADIQRLPPAHVLTAGSEGVRTRRYWRLPVPEPLCYRRDADYVDRFRELLQQAVADRLRCDRLTVWMSGGLDSTTIAALAQAQQNPPRLAAMTVYYEKLIPDGEREYAELAARAIGLPLHLLRADDFPLFDDGHVPAFPEPADEPMTALLSAQLQTSLANGHVVLTGDGGDELLYPSGLAHMLRALPPRQTWRAVRDYVRQRRALPPLGLGLRARLRAWRRREPRRDGVPSWIAPDFVARCHLRQRWQEVTYNQPGVPHRWRPGAYHGLTTPYWQSVFEFYDAGVLGVPLEFRLPFLDLRLVQFTLAMPPLPWFVTKELLRRCTVDLLPEKIRRRPKTPLPGEPLQEWLQQHEVKWLDDFTPVPLLHQFVDRRAVPRLSGRPLNGIDPYVPLRPFALNQWLRQLSL
ncbi:MAG: asparagine synthase-related protein [candidate division KSB1 bacterium]|nr:asparagine synthase-related protein [candidate division KSB1 bacterium]MDZ7276121.1 asparagine synthase-related protein [candidate division KSB1 bacterium]MDZ7287099.1 asparagine synthase-related protein [candidate division KSB1 bacterium]MDZ7296976.1 asparagine synthase-related protein [candidate division KSB1 bacterium]MDZ7306195.1 asparagine synthase-related protein [candidate division KSB1 bacterium]